jgi:hypothetical protein
MNQLRSEKELNKEVYAGNLKKYILEEEDNVKSITTCEDYNDKKEKTLQINRVKKRLNAGM